METIEVSSRKWLPVNIQNELYKKYKCKGMVNRFIIESLYKKHTEHILVNGFLPILEFDKDRGGLSRDRNPDRDWPELRRTHLQYLKEVTSKLKQVLIEDLAFAFGNNSEKFYQKLKEFNLINF